MVLIENIEMPNNCGDCPLLFEVDGDMYCVPTKVLIHGKDTCNGRNPNCPLQAHEWNELDFKCKSDVKICPDGENELDPCQYELIDRRENCVVEVLRCEKCGHIEVLWTDKDKHPELVDEE